MLDVSTNTRTPKRKLIDLKLAQSSAAMETSAYVTARRAADESWGKIAANIFALTGEHVTVPWLIGQFPELTNTPAEARP